MITETGEQYLRARAAFDAIARVETPVYDRLTRDWPWLRTRLVGVVRDGGSPTW